MLKQPQNSPIPVEKQVIIIYAVVSGALLDIPANQISEFEKELFSFVDSVYSDIPESIRTTGKLEDDVKEKLTKAIEECKSKFLSEHYAKGGTENGFRKYEGHQAPYQIGAVHHADHQGDGAGRVLQDAPREGACARCKTVLQRPVPDDYASGGCNARQRIGLYQTA